MRRHEIIDLPLAGLTANPESPRKISAAGRRRLAEQLERHGHVGVIVVRRLPDGSRRIVGGAQRVAELLARGESTAAGYVIECSDADERHLALVLNGHAGTWDEERLEQLLAEMHAAGEQVADLGIESSALDHLIDELRRVGTPGATDPDACPPVPVEPTSRPGEVWQLGPHRLAIGDACVPATWHALLGDERYHLLVTDPPYGVAYEGAAGAIANDDLDEAALQRFLTSALHLAAEHAAPGASCYIFHAESATTAFRLAARAAGWSIRQTLIWVKNSAVISRQDYHWRHEPILYGWKDGAAHRWCADRRQDTAWVSSGLSVTPHADGGHLLTFTDGAGHLVVLQVPSFTVVLGDDATSSAWMVDRPQRNPDHPTMKPVALCERMLANSSQPGDLVCDPFAGSGSTLLACERLGRVARCIELDPRFADVVLRRWSDFTGRTPERRA